MAKEYLKKLEYLGDYIIGDCKLKRHKCYKELYKYLEELDNANPSEALKDLENLSWFKSIYDKEIYVPDTKEYTTIKQALQKAQEQEKENELLKEIIKSLFDKGCPLHQYTDKGGTLVIEVDDECSIMHLGEFKGVNLDAKLKEVLDSE